MKTTDALKIMQHRFGKDPKYQKLLQKERESEAKKRIRNQNLAASKP